ncbi:hypothetical protein HELRODRAFT_67729, partial [Helobdella robusta]|uniref:Glutamate receptor n=1 Tax=Helobdella robusta TaxID=6412 RepID=T1FZ46_HELRO
QIQAVGMNRGGYHYLLGGLAIDEIDIDDFKHGGVNITGFLLINRSDIKIDLAQRDWAKLGEGPILKLEPALAMDAISILTNAFSNMLQLNNDEFSDVFRRNYNFGDQKVDACMGNVTGPWIKGASIARHLKELTYPGLTGYISFDRWGYRKDYMLGVYELSLNNGLKQVCCTGVPDDTPTAADLKPLAVNRTRIVTTIIVTATSTATTSDPSSQQAIGANKFEGYCAELTATLAQKVGFNYELRLVADEKYGAKTDNGTWNGMVGELTTKVADLAIAPLTISSIRERVIDFSKPFMNLGISIMIKKPEKQKPGVFSFMDPLAYDIWACIVISYLAVSFVLFLVSRFSPYEWQTDDNNNTNYDNSKDIGYTNDFTILNSLWFSLAAFMRQGCDISPRSLSGRVVGSAWWFFTLIIISSYTANLAAFLTVERMLTPIESADDLSQQTEILYGTLEAGSTKDFFKNSKILIYMNMWQFMSTHPDVFVKTTEDGVSRVRNSKGKYAFLLESTMNDYYNQKKPCNTMKVGSDLDSKGYGVATPIGSDLREPIGLAILQLLESSYLQKLHKKWWYDKGECIPEDTKGGSSTQSALTLSNVAGIFYILIGGLGLSMLTSLLEFIYKSKREILKQKVNGYIFCLKFVQHLQASIRSFHTNSKYLKKI